MTEAPTGPFRLDLGIASANLILNYDFHDVMFVIFSDHLIIFVKT